MKAIEEEQKSMTDEPELYNSKAIRAYVNYIKKEYPYIDVDELLIHSRIEPKDVVDKKQWFTQKQINLFADRLIELTGNENIGYDAGTFSAAPEAIGNYREYLLSLLSPEGVFKDINSIAKQLTRSCEYVGKSLVQNRVEIRVVPNENVKEIKMQCDNRRGYFEGVLKLFNISSFKIDHPECMFKENGAECKYILSWESSKPETFRKWIRIVPYLILFLLISLYFINIKNDLFVFLLILVLASFLLKDWIENKLINTVKDDTTKAYKKLMTEIENTYSQSQVVLSAAESISNENNVFDKVVEILYKQLGYNRGVIMLVNEETQRRLCYKKSFGYNENEIKAWNEQKGFDVSRDNSEGAFVVAYREKRPIWISDMQRIKTKLSERSQKLVDRLNVQALICCPIIYKNNVFGIMAIDQKSYNIPFRESDRNLLMGIARILGIAINYIDQLKEKELLQAKASTQDFAKRAIHNIRNPVEAIHTYIEYILRDFCDKMEPNLKETFIKIEPNIERIEQLLEDFSIWTKDPSKLRMETFSPDLIINNIITRFKFNQTKIKINICYEPNKIDIIGDKSSFEWIIEEMITNAHKNNAKKIIINVLKKNDYITLCFEDDGDGIKAEIKDKLFEPNETTDHMGTGLGLASIKKMVGEHNGFVSCEDTSIGAKFIINLPLNPNQKKNMDHSFNNTSNDTDYICDHSKNKLSIFISYSKKDMKFCEQIVRELIPLKHNDIYCWSDKEIEAGDEWDSDIKNNIENANIIICILSENFLCSEYIFNHELPLIKKKDYLIPILYEECIWKDIDWISKLQLLNEEPYCQCREKGEIIDKLRKRIKKIAINIRSKKRDS